MLITKGIGTETITDGKKEEAMLYYLYMMADGEITENEEKIFKKICRELKVMADNRKKIIKDCNEYVKGESSVFDVIKKEKIDERAGIAWRVRKDDTSLARMIWNLINLGYADSVYSDEEKEIVNHLVEKWSVEKEVYQEFIDAADTILALNNQKKWIEETFSDDDILDIKEKNIDSEINKIIKDVHLTIEELTM